MSGLHHAKHALEAAKHGIDSMKPLKDKKDPIIAGIAGMVLGAVGIALYFRSWADFFLCIGIFIGLTILIPGIGAVPGYLFAPVYGIYRANKSNETHG